MTGDSGDDGASAAFFTGDSSSESMKSLRLTRVCIIHELHSPMYELNARTLGT